MIKEKEPENVYDDIIEPKMTLLRAKRIRQLRVDYSYTWRAIASESFKGAWKKEDVKWDPPNNQLAGLALCKFAAKYFNEHYLMTPWNY